MPYITQELRTADLNPVTAGELNYKITEILHYYLLTKGESYSTYNDIMGALEGAKLEIYRRRVAPYEDKAIAKNGDLQ